MALPGHRHYHQFISGKNRITLTPFKPHSPALESSGAGFFLSFFNSGGILFLLPGPLVPEDQFLELFRDPFSGNSGSRISDGGDHDIKHDAAADTKVRGSDMGRHQRGNEDAHKNLPGIGKKKNIENNIIEGNGSFVQGFTCAI